MQRINARWLGLLAITLIALYLCWLVVSPFVDVILWAVVLAIIAYPYHLKMRRKGVGPTWAALISTLGVVLVVLLPILAILLALASQIPNKEELSDLIVKAKEMISTDSRIYKIVDPYVDLDWLKDPAIVKQRAQQIASPLAQNSVVLATAAVGNIAGTTIEICFALFTLFYFLRDNRTIGESVAGMLPLEPAQSKEVFKRCQDIIQASVQGVIVIAAIQGLLGGIGFWIAGVPSPILWGVIMFILSMIPALGAFLVWVPAAIFLAATGHWGWAIFLTIWGGAVIGSIDNFLRPRLVGQKTGMHDLVIFFSVLGGLQVFGILGLFVGPVVVAIALSIMEVFKQASLNWRDPPKTPVIIDPSNPQTVQVNEPIIAHPMEIDPPRA